MTSGETGDMNLAAGSSGKLEKAGVTRDAGKRHLPHETLVRLSDYLERYMGLFYPQKKWNDLERQIMKSLADFNFSDSEAFVDWLLSSVPRQGTRLRFWPVISQ